MVSVFLGHQSASFTQPGEVKKRGALHLEVFEVCRPRDKAVLEVLEATLREKNR